MLMLLDTKDLEAIDEVITKNNISFSTCVEILKLMGPVSTQLSPSGSIAWLKEKIWKDPKTRITLTDK